MIQIVAVRSASRVTAFKVSGHAGYAEAGEDIVCAGVSAVTQTALRGLQNYLSEPPRVEGGSDGYLQVELPDLAAEDAVKADLIIGTMLIGLADLQETYPELIELKYIKETPRNRGSRQGGQ
jgi:uncharacterized protein YsxB (DUF464 family)